MRRYLTLLLSIFFGVLALIAAINVVVDPLNVYRVVSIPGVTSEKTRIHGTGMRIAKATAVEREKPETVIFGTSRAEVALDPFWDGFQGSVYNAALPDTNMVEIAAMVRHTLETAHPKTIIFGLDLLAFSDEYAARHDFEWSPLSDRSAFDMHMKLLFSRKITSLSFKTISENLRGRKAVYDARGGLFHLSFDDQGGHRAMFNSSLTPRSYARFHYNQDRFELFRDVVTEAVASGATVHLYISPVHAWTVEAFSVLGLDARFNQWKRDLTTLTADLSTQCPTGRDCIDLWDFSGFNSVTTEPVPPYGDTTRMLNYWENSHATRRVGNWVLDRLFNRPTDAPIDFGTQLTPDTIDQRLAEQNGRQADFRTRFAGDLPDIRARVTP